MMVEGSRDDEVHVQKKDTSPFTESLFRRQLLSTLSGQNCRYDPEDHSHVLFCIPLLICMYDGVHNVGTLAQSGNV